MQVEGLSERARPIFPNQCRKRLEEAVKLMGFHPWAVLQVSPGQLGKAETAGIRILKTVGKNGIELTLQDGPSGTRFPCVLSSRRVSDKGEELKTGLEETLSKLPLTAPKSQEASAPTTVVNEERVTRMQRIGFKPEDERYIPKSLRALEDALAHIKMTNHVLLRYDEATTQGSEELVGVQILEFVGTGGIKLTLQDFPQGRSVRCVLVTKLAEDTGKKLFERLKPYLTSQPPAGEGQQPATTGAAQEGSISMRTETFRPEIARVITASVRRIENALVKLKTLNLSVLCFDNFTTKGTEATQGVRVIAFKENGIVISLQDHPESLCVRCVLKSTFLRETPEQFYERLKPFVNFDGNPPRPAPANLGTVAKSQKYPGHGFSKNQEGIVAFLKALYAKYGNVGIPYEGAKGLLCTVCETEAPHKIVPAIADAGYLSLQNGVYRFTPQGLKLATDDARSPGPAQPTQPQIERRPSVPMTPDRPGFSHSAPPAFSAPQKYAGKGFSSNTEGVGVYLKKLRALYPLGIVPYKNAVAVLGEIVDAERPGIIFVALVRFGYFTALGEKKYQILADGTTPVPTAHQAKSKMNGVALPGDHPAAQRLNRLSAILVSQTTQFADIATKEEELKRLREKQAALTAEIAAKEAALIEAKSALPPDEVLEAVDSAIEKLGNYVSQDVGAASSEA